jgi:hypothetical protein
MRIWNRDVKCKKIKHGFKKRRPTTEKERTIKMKEPTLV